MKKIVWICCTFLIFNFQFSILNCYAQIDSVAVNITDTLNNEFKVQGSKFNDTNEQEFEVSGVARNASTIQEFKGSKTLIPKSSLSSKNDSIQIKKHNPKTASWLAIIPGAGQIYNKKYWKLPIVYCSLGVSAFLIYYYEDLTSMYRKEYVARVNDKIDKLNPKLAKYSDANILELRNFYRRNMEICVAACTILYVLSILDACVDAHLFYYDVSDNLTLGVKPKVNYNPMLGVTSPGMGLVLKF